MGLHERAAARMRTMIVRGELAPGPQTQETRLSKDLGVSRTPLREAMKVLAAEGLIELRPNRSPRIADIAVVNHAKLPAISIPCGPERDPTGLPIGLQMIAGRGRDLMLLDAARHIEAILGP
jgi:DNA-binding FadR family transcriptional regulator